VIESHTPPKTRCTCSGISQSDCTSRGQESQREQKPQSYRPTLRYLLIPFSIYLAALAALLIGLGMVWAQSGSLDCSTVLPPSDEDARFFPAGTFGPGLAGTDIARAHFCHLRLMGEHPLEQYLSDGRGQVYRLMIWPAYRLPLIVGLTVKPDGTGELRAKAEKSKLQPGTLSVDRTAEVTKSEVDRLLILLEQADFWSLPTDEYFVENQRRAAQAAATGVQKVLAQTMDGVESNLEGAVGTRYHLVSRKLSEPGPNRSWENSPYGVLTLYLFRDLAKLEVPPIETSPTRH
jgi:hypothetical protein